MVRAGWCDCCRRGGWGGAPPPSERWGEALHSVLECTDSSKALPTRESGDGYLVRSSRPARRCPLLIPLLSRDVVASEAITHGIMHSSERCDVRTLRSMLRGGHIVASVGKVIGVFETVHGERLSSEEIVKICFLFSIVDKERFCSIGRV